MGRIHDALKRAERERALLEGRPTRAEDLGGDEPVGASVPFAGGAREVPADPAPVEVPLRRAAAPAPAPAVEPTAPARPAAERPAEPRRIVPAAARTARLTAVPLEPPIENEYKSLRARIQSLRRNRPIRSLVVTSARPGEGKTTTALNLARSYGAEREFDTCLVDLDLRNPDVHRSLSGGDADLGPTAVLERAVGIDEAWVRIEGSRLHVLAGATQPADPSELLDSLGMAELVTALHEQFGMVLVDSPPVLGLPDTTEIVDRFDAVLLVVGASSTTARDVDEVLERIDGEKLIGTVLNRCETPSRAYGYGYYGGGG